MIRLNNVTKKFGSNEVLKGMNTLRLHAIKTMSRPYDLHETEINRPGSMMTVRPDSWEVTYVKWL